MHRYEMCQGKSMFSSLQFIYYYYLIFVDCHSNAAHALYIICISGILYNYWAYLKSIAVCRGDSAPGQSEPPLSGLRDLR